MLRALSIRDVVLIHRVDLQFRPGLCVLTGETGAGKSILLDSLSLALGARGDSALVRAGADQASVAAEFDLPADHPAFAILAEQDMAAEDGSLVLRRSLGADGRGRAFVNDRAASINLLRRIGDTLVEIEGQFAAQGLLDSTNHRAALDAYADAANALGRVRHNHKAWQDAAQARRAAEDSIARTRAEEEELRHALAQIEKLDPKPGEEAQLLETRALLMNREKLADALNAALADLGLTPGGEALDRQLRRARAALERAASLAAGRFDAALAALDRAALELGEAGAAIEAAGAGLAQGEDGLEAVDDRLHELRALARRHKVAPDELARLCDELRVRLAAIDGSGEGLRELQATETRARAEFAAAIATLGQARRKAAKALDKAVNVEFAPLKLEKARFHTRLDPLPESEWGPNGAERVVFEVQTNPGTPMGDLAKIASGGELARIMLALRVALARTGAATTLVFDEVDSGIGGAVAAAVGERLARLAEAFQVLVVTHSPQVAARGHDHWHVEKTASGGDKKGTTTGDASMRTDVRRLDEAERREEIARLMSGAEVTDDARRAADRLIEAGRP